MYYNNQIIKQEVMNYFELNQDWQLEKALNFVGYVMSFVCLIYSVRKKIYPKYINGTKKFDSLIFVLVMTLITILQILSCIMEHSDFSKVSSYGCIAEFCFGTLMLWTNFYRCLTSKEPKLLNWIPGKIVFILLPILIAGIHYYWQYFILTLATLNFLVISFVIIHTVLGKEEQFAITVISLFFISMSSTSSFVNSLNVDGSGVIKSDEIAAITKFINAIRGSIFLAVIHATDHLELNQEML